MQKIGNGKEYTAFRRLLLFIGATKIMFEIVTTNDPGALRFPIKHKVNQEINTLQTNLTK